MQTNYSFQLSQAGYGVGGSIDGLRLEETVTRDAAWLANQPLPSAINVSFFDGHAELVRLDRLWQLYWHNDYQPPAKRPGLP